MASGSKDWTAQPVALPLSMLFRMLLLGLLLRPNPAWTQTQPWIEQQAVAIRTGAFDNPIITESSGLARSRSMQGRFYTLNDSGNKPDLFLIDSSGHSYGPGWRVSGVRNRDWEALSVGRCPAGSCVYIGDTGDNQEHYPTVVIYRLREPTSPARFMGKADPAPLDLDSLVLHYPDHPHDLEAIYLDDQNLFMVSKGRTEGILLFRVPLSAWDESGVVTPELLQKLPIEPDHSAGRWVTDAARSTDGKRVVIRTYTELYLFDLETDGHLKVPPRPVVCLIGGLEPQGEGIDWVDGKRMLLTSERAILGAGPLHLVECPGW